MLALESVRTLCTWLVSVCLGLVFPVWPVLACGGGRADMAENRNTAKEGKVALPWDLAGTNERRVWTDAACVT